MRTAIVGLLALVVSAGCASSGVPGPSAHGPVPASTAAPAYPVPDSPRDARGLVACRMLTVDQLVELGLDPTTGDQIGSGRSQACSWNVVGEQRRRAGLSIYTELPASALSGEYDVADLAAVFEPLEISGHPAVRIERVATEGCSLTVAVARYQKLGVDVERSADTGTPPCAAAIRMAELVLSNLPPLTRSER